jgi:carbamate kinase
MGPKVRAGIEFVEAGRGEVVITSPGKLAAAVQGRAGTRIVAAARPRRARAR